MATMVQNGGPIFSHLPSQSGFEASVPAPSVPINDPAFLEVKSQL